MFIEIKKHKSDLSLSLWVEKRNELLYGDGTGGVLIQWKFGIVAVLCVCVGLVCVFMYVIVYLSA